MPVEIDLQQERVSHLDLSTYVTVRTGTPVREALARMRQDRISAVLVEDDERSLAGIFTERDVLLKVADNPSTLDHPIDDFMTADPQSVNSGDSVGDALRLMNAGDYRNVPVRDENGAVIGNLSQQALITFLTDRFPREIYNLPPDPEMIPRTREGA